MDNIKIGNFLQSLRKEKHITQNDLAQEFGISNKTVSKWECGDALPEIPLLKALAEYYNVTVDEILNGERNIDNKEEIKMDGIKKSSKMNSNFISLISSIFITYLIFLVSITIGYVKTNGLVAGLVGVIGGFSGIFIYFIISYFVDKSFYSNIRSNKYNIFVLLTSMIFEIIISIVLVAKCDKSSIIIFKYYLIYIIRIISVYGFIAALALLFLIDNERNINNIFKIVFIVFMILFNLYCNLAYFINYTYYFYGIHNIYVSLYSPLLKYSECNISFLPLVISLSIIVYTFYIIINKMNINIILFIGLLNVAAAIIAIFNFPSCSDIVSGTFEHRSSYCYPTWLLFVILGFYIIYIILYYILISIFGNKKITVNEKKKNEIDYKRFKRIMFETIFFILIHLIGLSVLIFQSALDDPEISYAGLGGRIFKCEVVMIIQFVVLVISIISFIILVYKNKSTLFSFIMVLINSILVSVTLRLYPKGDDVNINDNFDIAFILISTVLSLYVFFEILYIAQTIKERDKTINNNGGQEV